MLGPIKVSFNYKYHLKYNLITTPIALSRANNKLILFLGDWCKNFAYVPKDYIGKLQKIITDESVID